jgi:hypothetical protein
MLPHMNKLTRYSWIITAIVVALGGVLLFFGLADYGFSFFIIFPVAVGFSIGTLGNRERKNASLVSLIGGLLVALLWLVIGGIEGWICVVMAIPLLALLMAFGYGLARLMIRRFNVSGTESTLKVILSPLLILLVSNSIETFFQPDDKPLTVTNSILLSYAPEKIFDGVKAMDKLDGEKPWLLALGLPAPYKCELENNSIGAKRICLFENGRIVAEITDYKRGKLLQMKVVDYNLTGNQWFTFIDAAYTFEEVKGQTRLTRTTSYQSTLKPRIYWQWLERYAIEQEHQFVLHSLKKNLDELPKN